MKTKKLIVYLEVPDDYIFDENPIWDLEDAFVNSESKCNILEVYEPKIK